MSELVDKAETTTPVAESNTATKKKSWADDDDEDVPGESSPSTLEPPNVPSEAPISTATPAVVAKATDTVTSVGAGALEQKEGAKAEAEAEQPPVVAAAVASVAAAAAPATPKGIDPYAAEFVPGGAPAAAEGAAATGEAGVAAGAAQEVSRTLQARASRVAREDNADREAAAFFTRLNLSTESEDQKQARLKVIQSNPDSHLSSAKTFEELQLHADLMRGLGAMNIVKPSAIQEHAMPLMLKNPPENLIAQAQSGSGKTIAFCLGLLSRIDTSRNVVQALIVTPTRELAVQCVEQTLLPMARFVEPKLKVAMALKGTMLDRGTRISDHVVVGTPGKVEAWLKGRYMDMSNLRVFVLDEADEMLSYGGFREDCVRIKKFIRCPHQSLLFSATFPSEVIHFSKKLVPKPLNEITLASDEELVLPFICQIWVDLRNQGPDARIGLLGDLYEIMELGQSIVFCKTRNEVRAVAARLNENGYDCSEMHGQVEGADRDKAMQAFREGVTKVLITSNVLARGVDVPAVSLVVNFDMPVDVTYAPDTETYLHRIGRTGRFGRKGVAINFVHDNAAMSVVEALERHFSPNKPMMRRAEADLDAIEDIIKETLGDGS